MEVLENPVVQCVARAARTHLGAPRIWLFGSRARGTHQRTSDYDFAVEPGAFPVSARAWAIFLAYLDDAAPTLNRLDVIDLATLSRPSLRDEIVRTGIAIDTHDFA